MKILIAWRNCSHNRRRFAATLTGVAFSILLVIVQFGLLIGFSGASSSVIDSSGADIWIAPPGILAFEFASSLDERVGDRIRHLESVETVEPLVAGFAEWRREDVRTSIAIVGTPDSKSIGLPDPKAAYLGPSIAEPVLLHAGNGRALGITHIGQEAEIGGRSIIVAGFADSFPSFLGGPYIFVDVDFARRAVGMPPGKAAYLLVKLRDGFSPDSDVLAEIQRLIPNYDVYSAAEFASKSSSFWLAQTGAGGGFVVTAIMGFVVGTVVVALTLYSNVLEQLKQYATLKAVGASSRDLSEIVLWEAFLSGLIGSSIGAALSVPVSMTIKRYAVSWISVPPPLIVVIAVLGVLMAMLAAILAVRLVTTSDPVTVFRG